LNENFPAYHLFTAFLASNLHSNSPVRLKKKLVGISHYGHFSKDTIITTLAALLCADCAATVNYEKNRENPRWTKLPSKSNRKLE
jgi:hypothetical protein